MPKEEAPKLRLISAGLHSEVTEWDVETLEPIETCSPGALAVLIVRPRLSREATRGDAHKGIAGKFAGSFGED